MFPPPPRRRNWGGTPGDADYSDVPVATRILGAAKLTGKLAPSLHFGTMHALTGREEADYSAAGVRGTATVEPLTYYGVTSGLKESRSGYNGLGAMATLVQRRFDGSGLGGLLNRQALLAAVDGWHFLDRDRMWVLSGWAGATRVAGTTERMIALQNSSRHYMQRPDASHLGVDSSATSLSGYGARVWLNKQDGNLIGNAALGLLSPGFDVNDMGYQPRSDVVVGHGGLQYRFRRPNRVWHDALTALVTFHDFDFGGHHVDGGYWQGNTVTFANDWMIDTELMVVPPTTNVRRTRGGPRMAERPGSYGSVTFSTANRKRVVFSLFANRIHTMVLATFAMAGLTVVLGLAPAFWLYLAAMGAFGLALPLFNTPSGVLVQDHVEADYLGRVFSILTMISTSIMPLGMLLFGPLAEGVKIEWMLLATGALMAGLGLAALANRRLVEAGHRPEVPPGSAGQPSVAPAPRA